VRGSLRCCAIAATAGVEETKKRHRTRHGGSWRIARLPCQEAPAAFRLHVIHFICPPRQSPGRRLAFPRRALSARPRGSFRTTTAGFYPIEPSRYISLSTRPLPTPTVPANSRQPPALRSYTSGRPWSNSKCGDKIGTTLPNAAPQSRAVPHLSFFRNDRRRSPGQVCSGVNYAGLQEQPQCAECSKMHGGSKGILLRYPAHPVSYSHRSCELGN
jgi:hypothetical protein